MAKKLTIGIPTYQDYDGLYFTLTSLLVHHDLGKACCDYEIIVLDNDPKWVHAETVKKLCERVRARYIPIDSKTSTSVKWLIPEYAEGEYVLVMDSHVLLAPGAIEGLMEYYGQNPDTKNLIQGSLLYDDFVTVSTSFRREWSSHMYGVWQRDPEFELKQPFEIEMTGMGLFSFKKSNFPEVNQYLTGFVPEEWYVHEKFRRNGGKVICLPTLMWMHRFDRPNGVPYPFSAEDRIRNYYMEWLELYHIDHPMMVEMTEYFKNEIDAKKLQYIIEQALAYHER
jgi:glycosyltransferase involved in cell wall biosynthesis